MKYYTAITTRPNGEVIRAWADEAGRLAITGFPVLNLPSMCRDIDVAASNDRVIAVCKSQTGGRMLVIEPATNSWDDLGPVHGEQAVGITYDVVKGFQTYWVEDAINWVRMDLSSRIKARTPLGVPDGTSQGFLGVDANGPRWTDQTHAAVIGGKTFTLWRKLANGYTIGQGEVPPTGGVVAGIAGQTPMIVAAIPTFHPPKGVVRLDGLMEVAISHEATNPDSLFIASDQWVQFAPATIPIPVLNMPPMPAIAVGYLGGELVAPGTMGGTGSGKPVIMEGFRQADAKPWWPNGEKVQVMYVDLKESKASQTMLDLAKAEQERARNWICFYSDSDTVAADANPTSGLRTLTEARKAVAEGRPVLLGIRMYPNNRDSLDVIVARAREEINQYKAEFPLALFLPGYNQSGSWATADVINLMQQAAQLVADYGNGVIRLVSFFGWQRPPMIPAIDESVKTFCSAIPTPNVGVLLPAWAMSGPPVVVVSPPITPTLPAVVPTPQPVSNLSAIIRFFRRLFR